MILTMCDERHNASLRKKHKKYKRGEIDHFFIIKNGQAL